MRQNNRKYQWIDDILCALAGNDSLSDDEYQETLTKLLVSIGKDHEEVFREVEIHELYDSFWATIEATKWLRLRHVRN